MIIYWGGIWRKHIHIWEARISVKKFGNEDGSNKKLLWLDGNEKPQILVLKNLQ